MNPNLGYNSYINAIWLQNFIQLIKLFVILRILVSNIFGKGEVEEFCHPSHNDDEVAAVRWNSGAHFHLVLLFPVVSNVSRVQLNPWWNVTLVVDWWNCGVSRLVDRPIIHNHISLNLEKSRCRSPQDRRRQRNCTSLIRMVGARITALLEKHSYTCM